jgi:hypothetical protein
VALIGESVDGETPLTADDLQGLKLPFSRLAQHGGSSQHQAGPAEHVQGRCRMLVERSESERR